MIGERDERGWGGLGILDTTAIKDRLTFDEYAGYTEKLKEESLSIAQQRQNLIRGTIKLSKAKLLFFSIPYDSGWKARVDGKRQSLEIVNIGFMGLMLDKGEHAIELEYEQPLLVPGAIVSAAGIALYIFLVWRKRGQQKSTV